MAVEEAGRDPPGGCSIPISSPQISFDLRATGVVSRGFRTFVEA
jgi:hypothetical protein